MMLKKSNNIIASIFLLASLHADAQLVITVDTKDKVFTTLEEAYAYPNSDEVLGLLLRYNDMDALFLRQNPDYSIRDFKNLSVLSISESIAPIEDAHSRWIEKISTLEYLESLNIPSSLSVGKINSLRQLSITFNGNYGHSMYENTHVSQLYYEDFISDSLTFLFEHFSLVKELELRSTAASTFLLDRLRGMNELNILTLHYKSLKSFIPSKKPIESIQNLVLFSDSLYKLDEALNSLVNLKICFLSAPNLFSISPEFFKGSSIQSLFLEKSRLEAIPEGIGQFTSVFELNLALASLEGDYSQFQNLPHLTTLNISQYADKEDRKMKRVRRKEKKLKKVLPGVEVHISK